MAKLDQLEAELKQLGERMRRLTAAQRERLGERDLAGLERLVERSLESMHRTWMGQPAGWGVEVLQEFARLARSRLDKVTGGVDS